VSSKWNKDDIKKGLIFAVSLCLVVLFSQLLGKIGVIGHAIGRFFSAMTPIIAGCVIAFLLNPIMNFFKYYLTKLFVKLLGEERKRKASRIANAFAVAFTILVFVALIAAFLWVLIPELRDSIVKLYGNIPDYIENIRSWIKKILSQNPEMEEYFDNSLTNFQNNITTIINDKLLPNMDTIIVTISSGIVGGIKFVLNFAIGIIVAVYILGSKEELGAQCKKIIYSIFDKKKGNKVLDGLDFVNSVFGGFINGKIIDSLIIGIICAIFCKGVDMPYAVLISVVIGVTNIIPFFGPFIGAIPSALLVLVDDPMMCVVFVIFIVILQQIDGNIIGPIILGDSTGLSGLWIMFAILVGGDLFGFAGMILGVPVFACIYTLLTILLRERLKKKGLTNSTAYYITLRRFDEETGEPVRGPKPKRVSAKKRKKHMKHMDALQHAKENLLHLKQTEEDAESQREAEKETDEEDSET
jgi:predicted PurR-regulated permease PerM